MQLCGSTTEDRMNLNNLNESEKDAIIKEFLEFFGGKVPNPVNYPKSFEFYLKMYEFHLRNKKNKESK
jgi:hypothetical protein